MDVYDWLALAAQRGDRYDRVFCSYGAICWLPDLLAWARGVAAVLAPGGRFALVEFHPASNMFDRDWRLAHPYPSGGRLLELPGIDDYVGESGEGLTPGGFAAGVSDFRNPEACFLFQWGVGEVVTALALAGLVIETLREHPYCNGERPFAEMRETAGRRMLPPEGVPAIPLMYGIAARR
jgi:SAM-dependent methyltransferase